MKFGDGLELDRAAYELRRSGRALKLERIPMEILLLLLDRKGQLVSREEIIEKIWGKDVFLDTDNSINSAVRKVRQALKDDPENPAYIQTVTGKGYRFIAAVTESQVPESPPIAPVEPSNEATPLEPPAISHATGTGASGKMWWAVGLTLVSLAAIGISIAWLRSRRPSPPHRVMLAVLPFAI